MAQVYNKADVHSKVAFDSTKVFLNESEIVRLSGSTYLGVLNVFRKVFKGLNINDLLS